MARGVTTEWEDILIKKGLNTTISYDTITTITITANTITTTTINTKGITTKAQVLVNKGLNPDDFLTDEELGKELGLNELNKATAPTFSLTLDSTGTTKQDAAAVSQKIYSTIKQ